eukprot:SAG11_NODE_14901_length_595_cov_1.687500_1_plen_56_part_00
MQKNLTALEEQQRQQMQEPHTPEKGGDAGAAPSGKELSPIALVNPPAPAHAMFLR